MHGYLARVLYVLSRVLPSSLACWYPRGCPLCSVGRDGIVVPLQVQILFPPVFPVG